LRDCARLGGSNWNVDRIVADVWRLGSLADLPSLMVRTAEPRRLEKSTQAMEGTLTQEAAVPRWRLRGKEANVVSAPQASG
jgi:hypothetical protein